MRSHVMLLSVRFAEPHFTERLKCFRMFGVFCEINEFGVFVIPAQAGMTTHREIEVSLSTRIHFTIPPLMSFFCEPGKLSGWSD
jgi:hypothetical protein